MVHTTKKESEEITKCIKLTPDLRENITIATEEHIKISSIYKDKKFSQSLKNIDKEMNLTHKGQKTYFLIFSIIYNADLLTITNLNFKNIQIFFPKMKIFHKKHEISLLRYFLKREHNN